LLEKKEKKRQRPDLNRDILAETSYVVLYLENSSRLTLSFGKFAQYRVVPRWLIFFVIELFYKSND